MPNDLKPMCDDYTKKFKHEPFWTYKSVADSKMWTIPPLGENRKRINHTLLKLYLKKINALKQSITAITDLKLEQQSRVDCIWRFDENFNHCPIHIDAGGEHTGSVVASIFGNFKIHLHAEDVVESPIIESIAIDESTIIALNNTEFPHSVEGQGDLLVFGADKHMKPEEYFADV